MTPRLNVGKGVTGAVRYVLGEGRDPKTGELEEQPDGLKSRVEWIGGTGFGFEIKNEADAELARRVMEFEALNQGSPTRQCEKDCVHLSLSWRPGETPTRSQMEEAARGALDALGMGNAKALFVAHNDEDYAHVHIVASKINPATARAYDLEKSWRTLSTWAEGYERDHGGIISTRRQDANELRAAIAHRDAGGVLEAMTRQKCTFTPAELERTLQKEIRNEFDRAEFGNEILARPEVIRLAERPGGAAVVVLVLAFYFAEFGRAVAILERAEHTAPVDAGKLAVVTDKNKLRSGVVGESGDDCHKLGVEHGGLVHDDGGFSVPVGAAVVEREDFAMDRRRVGEAVGAHVLRDGVGRGQADDAVAGGFVSFAHGGNGEAFAGSGLPVDDGDTFGAGRVPEGAGLFAGDAVVFVAVEYGCLLPVADVMTIV